MEHTSRPGGGVGLIDLEGDAFARRLATLLREHRRTEGLRLAAVARRSQGRFSTRELRAVEAGAVRADQVVDLAALYGADLASILPERTVVEVDPAGTVTAAGAAETFDTADPDSLLTAYLVLIRRLRSAERDPVVALRRDDIETLADAVGDSAERVLERLGELMGATRAQRKAMVGLLVAGAVVVGVAVTAVAASGGEPTDRSEPSPVASVPVTEAPIIAPAGDDPAGDDPAGDELAGVEGDPDPVTVFVDEPWTGPVPPSPDLDVTPLPDPADEAPTQPAPAPTPAPAPAPENDPEVDVGPPPVPVPTAPVVDPVEDAPPAAPAPPAPPPPTEESGESGEPDVAVGPPPVPTTTAPIVDP